jgi:hypothetical protein
MQLISETLDKFDGPGIFCTIIVGVPVVCASLAMLSWQAAYAIVYVIHNL